MCSSAVGLSHVWFWGVGQERGSAPNWRTECCTRLAGSYVSWLGVGAHVVPEHLRSWPGGFRTALVAYVGSSQGQTLVCHVCCKFVRCNEQNNEWAPLARWQAAHGVGFALGSWVLTQIGSVLAARKHCDSPGSLRTAFPQLLDLFAQRDTALFPCFAVAVLTRDDAGRSPGCSDRAVSCLCNWTLTVLNTLKKSYFPMP